MSCPKYTVRDYESSSITVAPRIKFHQYNLFSACSIHGLIGEGMLRCNICEVKKSEGKIRSRKMMTLKELENGNFTYDIYLPSLEKYTYYVHYVHSLSKNLCGRLRDDACYSKPGNICTIRYCTERISVNFNLEINLSILETVEVSRSKNAILRFSTKS